MKKNVEKLILVLTGEQYRVEIGDPSVNLQEKIVYLPTLDLASCKGFIDHECGHILFSPNKKQVGVIENLFEDVRIEELLKRKFPGCKKILGELTKVIRQKILSDRILFKELMNASDCSLSLQERAILLQWLTENIVSAWKPIDKVVGDLLNLIPPQVKTEVKRLCGEKITSFSWTQNFCKNRTIIEWLSGKDIGQKTGEGEENNGDNKNNKDNKDSKEDEENRNKTKKGKGDGDNNDNDKDKDNNEGKKMERKSDNDSERKKGKGKDKDNKNNKGEAEETRKLLDKLNNSKELKQVASKVERGIERISFVRNDNTIELEYYTKVKVSKNPAIISPDTPKLISARPKINGLTEEVNKWVRETHLKGKIQFQMYKGVNEKRGNTQVIQNIDTLIKSKKYFPYRSGLKLRTSKLASVFAPVSSDDKLFLRRKNIPSIGISFLIDMSDSVKKYMHLIMYALKQIQSIIRENPQIKLQVVGFTYFSNIVAYPQEKSIRAWFENNYLYVYKDFNDADIQYANYRPEDGFWICTPIWRTAWIVAKNFPNDIVDKYIIILTDGEDNSALFQWGERKDEIKVAEKQKGIHKFGIIYHNLNSFRQKTSLKQSKFYQDLCNSFGNFILFNTSNSSMDTIVLQGFECFFKNIDLIKSSNTAVQEIRLNTSE